MSQNMYLDGTYLANTGGTWNTDDCPFKAHYIAELPVNSLKRAVARLPRKLMFPVAPDLTVRLLGGYSLMALARPKA